MKKLITILPLIALLAFTASAQTTNNPSTWDAFIAMIKGVGSDMSTNMAVVGYGTYNPKGSKANHTDKFGGGLLTLWNVAGRPDGTSLGAGLGLDYLGRFTQISGDIQLKVPTHPLSFLGMTNFTSTPWVIAGVGAPVGGNNTAGVSAITAAGMSFDLARVAGGTVFAGAGISYWSGAGDYSGSHYQIEGGWRRGF